TFFVASAGHARVVADASRVFRLGKPGEQAHRSRTRILCFFFPFLSLGVYYFYRESGRLVLYSGICQGIMLPMLGAASLFFRYRRCDPRLQPGKLWDALLWISVVGLLVSGAWTVLVLIYPQIQAKL